ncbi:MAG: hypothetical protein QM438_09355 [Euryarchaeota archaeon]|nr:hypothetical protein [Euryarchaeota archaeon]
MPTVGIGEKEMRQKYSTMLTARMPAPQRAALEQFADDQEVSVGEAVRMLIAAGLEAKKW